MTDNDGSDTSDTLTFTVNNVAPDEPADPDQMVDNPQDISASLDVLEDGGIIAASTKVLLNVKIDNVIRKLHSDDPAKAIKKLEDLIAFIDQLLADGRIGEAQRF